MNDYSFGNMLFNLRKKVGLSQTELAVKIGVTNKAVSKWENGVTKPTTDSIRKLSALYHISVNELLAESENKKIPEISKIVITGGPCGGKSTAMSWIHEYFTKLGYSVLFIPETATELITGGVSPTNCGRNIDFQKCIVKLQLEKESVFEEAALSMSAGKVLVVCDRGIIDNKAYMNDSEFTLMLYDMKCNEIEIRDNYDAIFHLVTAAKGAEHFYTTSNNCARTETLEEATILDNRLISAWTGHPHFRIIDNSTDFENKMKRLLKEISAFLGEPEPYEIERKFLIEYPDIKWLTNNPNCQMVEIIQTYLNSNNDDEIRIRQRGSNGNYVYFKTIKKKVTDIKRIEIESKITREEYLMLLMEADTAKRQIRKNRYCLTYNSQYFEIDVYPFWSDKAIVEIELTNENELIDFPDKIKIIKEVTDDENYKNASLANI